LSSFKHVAHPGIAVVEQVERALGAIERPVAIQAGTEALKRRSQRCRDEIERRRVARLVRADLGHLGGREVARRRSGERHDLQHACIRLQHRAQRHAERRLSRLVEALFSPANLDKASLAEG
jgi:hypothetical protein